jgi:hypothetical protein
MSVSSLYDVDPEICGREMDIARKDYELVMNKCIFDANILNRYLFVSMFVLFCTTLVFFLLVCILHMEDSFWLLVFVLEFYLNISLITTK